MRGRILYLFLAFAVLFSSCREEADVSRISRPLSFVAVSDNRTRSTQEESTFEKGDAIGIYAFLSKEGKTDFSKAYAANARYIYNGDAFEPATSYDGINYTGADLDFYVYYPYDEAQTDIRRVTHKTADQSSREGWLRADFLTATYTGPIIEYSVPLNFKHRYSTIEIGVNEDDGTEGVTLESAYTSSTADLTQGSVISGGGRTDIKMYPYSRQGSLAYYRATLPVQTISAQQNPFKVRNADGTEITFKGASDLSLKEGKVFQYNIEYRKDININDYLPGGTTTGAGKYRLAAQCTVNAVPKDGYTFIGWYEGGSKTSSKASYTFSVTADRTLVPHYRNYSSWKVEMAADPATIPGPGGSSAITANAVRSVYDNGNAVNRESQPAVLSNSNPAFSLAGNILSIGNNTTTDERATTVTGRYADASANVTVTQKGGAVTYGEWKVTVSANPSTIAASGGTSAISCSAVRDILIGGVKAREESATPALSGNAAGFTLSGKTVAATNNNSTSARSIIVTASHGGRTAQCTVTQTAGARLYGSWSEWTVTVSADPTSLPAAGGSSAITASATRTRSWNWNGASGSGGTETDRTTPTLSAVGTGFTLSGTSLTAANNTSTSERKCTVTASQGGRTAQCTVTQAAGSTTTEYGDWTTNSLTAAASPNPVAASGGSSALSCKANRTRAKYTKWNGVTTNTATESQSVAVTASWSKVSGSGTLSGSSVTFGNNTSTSVQSGTYRGSYSGKTSDVTVSQSAGSTITEYGSWTTNSLSVSASPSGIGASGGTSYLSATASQSRSRYTKWNGTVTDTTTETQDVNVSSSASWSGSATGFSRNGTTVTVSANGNTSPRSCTYTASYGGRSGSTVITQSGASITEEYIFELAAGNTTNLVESAAGSISYSVNSYKRRTVNGSTSNVNVSYSGSADVSWISAGNTSSSYQENTSESLRTGVVTLTQSESGKTITIQIRQKGKTIIDIS